MLQDRAVFIVDDDPSMLKGMGRLIKQYGFETVLFGTAAALKNSNFSQAFCIVLDINLGGESGIELRHQLVESGVDLPVIYITGNDSDATRMAAKASGYLAYLTKPFTAELLMNAIKKAALM